MRMILYTKVFYPSNHHTSFIAMDWTNASSLNADYISEVKRREYTVVCRQCSGVNFFLSLLFLAPVPSLTVQSNGHETNWDRGLARQKQGTCQKTTMPLIKWASSQEKGPGPGPSSSSGQILASQPESTSIEVVTPWPQAWAAVS
jgi:hypothetical protein